MAKQKDVTSKSKFEQTLEDLNKKYGVGTIATLDYKTTGNYDIISSGSLGVDYITLGVGGWVKGKLYELMGWEGVGKSTVCGHAVAECQKMGGTALYVDGEHALDKIYFQALGVDTSKLLIAQPSCGEEGFNITMDMINTGKIDLVIIDSDSSLIPKKVLEGEVGDSAIGKKALLNSSVYPKLKSALSENNTCVIVVSQYREKIGVMFGNPTTTQGGHALKFYTDCRIEISRTLSKEGDVTIGNLTKMKCVKNKMGSPYKTSEFIVIYGKGIDTFEETIRLAVDFDIINKSGAWFNYGETKLGQGISSVNSIMTDNPELYNEIKEKIVNKLKNVETKTKTDGIQPVSEVSEDNSDLS